MWSGITNMFYTSGEQPPFDCAWPLKDVGDLSAASKMLDAQHSQFTALLHDGQWAPIESYTDPEGGDLKLFTRPQIGTYHCLKAVFTLKGVTPQQFIDLVGSAKLAQRQKFSADCTEIKSVDQPTPMSDLVYAQYWAPPPVASRDFLFLVGRRENADDSWDLWGCSVSHPDYPEVGGMTVRGATLWGWHLHQIGDTLLVSYSNCFDPRGWTPSFLLAWLKTTAAKEFCAIRAVLLGKEANVDKVDFKDAGITEDQVNQESEKK